MHFRKLSFAVLEESEVSPPWVDELDIHSTFHSTPTSPLFLIFISVHETALDVLPVLGPINDNRWNGEIGG